MKKFIVIMAVVLVAIGLAWGGMFATRDKEVAVNNDIEQGTSPAPSSQKNGEEEKTKAVDIILAKTIISEQKQSRENMRRLVEGEVGSVTVLATENDGQTCVANITSTYNDNAQLNGTVEFINKDGNWYLSKVTREGAQALGGSTEQINANELKIGVKIVKEQRKDQAEIRDFINGNIQEINIGNISKKSTSATIQVTFRYKNNSTANGEARFEYADGCWYLTGLSKT